jgi:long-chain acyl-CoA synthetase
MLYHCAPLEGAVTALRMGHRVVLADDWRARRLLELIEAYEVTTAFMVPAMFVRMLKLDPATRARYSTRSLRFVVHGGAPCPVEAKRRMLRWWGPIIWESYGAAEAQGTIVSALEWLERPGTVGRPIPGAAIRVRDELGRDCAPGVIGRVYLRPHTGDRFAYRGDPDKTRACTDGAFVTVGDLGYLDAQGYLYLCERDTELILSSGMNIYPAEIEAVLVEHDAVEDCAVIAAPDTLFGQVPVAYVQVATGYHASESGLALALLDHLRSRLAPMKLPRRICFVARVPRDPNGKLLRRQLRTELAAPAGGR